MGERVQSAVALMPFDFIPATRDYIREYHHGPYSGTWNGKQLTEMLFFFTHPLTYSEVQFLAESAEGLVKEMPAKPGSLARFGIAESRVIVTGGPGVDPAGRVIDPHLLRAAAEAAKKVDVATLLLESTESLDDSPRPPPRPVSPPKITFHDPRPLPRPVSPPKMTFYGPPRPVSPVKKVLDSPVMVPESPIKAAQPIAASSKDDAEATAPVAEAAAPVQEEMPAEPTWKPRTIGCLARLPADRAAEDWNENAIARVVWTKPGEDGMSDAFLAFCRAISAQEQRRRVKKWVEEHGGTIVPRAITDQERDDIYRNKLAQWINPRKVCYYASWEESFKNPGVGDESSPPNQDSGPEPAPPTNNRRRGRPARTLAGTSSPKWVCTWQPHTYGALARLPAARAAEDWNRSMVARVAWTAPDEEGMSDACIVFCVRVKTTEHHRVKTEIEKHGGTIVERPAGYNDIDSIYMAKVGQWINPDRECLNKTWEAWFNDPVPRPQVPGPTVTIRTRTGYRKRKPEPQSECEDTSSTSSDKSEEEEEKKEEPASPSKRQRVDQDIAKQLAEDITRARSEASERHKALLAQLDARVAASKKEIASDLAKFGEEHKAAMQRVNALIGEVKEQITGFSSKDVAALLLDGVKTVARDELAIVPKQIADLASAVTRDAEEIAAIKKRLEERATPLAATPPSAWPGYPPPWYASYPPGSWGPQGWPGCPPPPAPSKP
jgi:hypothetical protein